MLKVQLDNSHIPLQFRNSFSDTINRIKQLANFSFFSDRELQRQLREIPAKDLTPLMQCVFEDLLKEGKDPLKVLEKLASLMPPLDRKLTKGELEAAKSLCDEARLYLAAKTSFSPSLKTHLQALLDCLVNFIESFLNVFGIAHILKPAEGELHASFKSQQLMMLIQLIFMLCTVLLPILGFEKGGVVIGGVFGGGAVLSLLFPYIKPIPNVLPANAENWTKEIREGKGGARGRKESLNLIANSLKNNRHALLIGESRVGKSVTAKAFAEAVERGDYPELAGCVVFRINTADIVGHSASFMGGGNDILFKIKDAMGRHAQKVILVFDEIHMACKDKTIADQFKPFLDVGGKFPRVIGITTKEESRHVYENRAFSLRFDPIVIESTNEIDNVQIVSEAVLKSPQNPLLTPGALQAILKAPGNPQPTAALKLLQKCIQATERAQLSPTQKRVADLTNEIASYHFQQAAMRSRETAQDISTLEAELEKFKEKERHEQEVTKQLQETKVLLDETTRLKYETALKGEGSLCMLLKEFLEPFLWHHIQVLGKALQVQTVIDTELVQRLSQES